MFFCREEKDEWKKTGGGQKIHDVLSRFHSKDPSLPSHGFRRCKPQGIGDGWNCTNSVYSVDLEVWSQTVNSYTWITLAGLHSITTRTGTFVFEEEIICGSKTRFRVTQWKTRLHAANRCQSRKQILTQYAWYGRILQVYSILQGQTSIGFIAWHHRVLVSCPLI